MDAKMIDSINVKLVKYLARWQEFEKSLINAGLDGPLKPTAIGWKVANRKNFDIAHTELMAISEQCHVGTVDNRLIGSYVLKTPLAGVPIIKLMQLRPGSQDPTGMDHMDFYVEDLKEAKKALEDINADWKEESNEVHSWLSVRFGKDLKYEAKFVDHLVLGAAIKELQLSIDKII